MDYASWGSRSKGEVQKIPQERSGAEVRPKTVEKPLINSVGIGEEWLRGKMGVKGIVSYQGDKV